MRNPVKTFLTGLFSGAAAALAGWGLQKLHNRREEEPCDETGQGQQDGRNGHREPPPWRSRPAYARSGRPFPMPQRSVAAGYHHRGDR